MFHTNQDIFCPKTKIQLFNDSNTHVDHNYELLPFRTLISNFIKQYGITESELEILREYHEQHSQLRLIHVSANLKEF